MTGFVGNLSQTAPPTPSEPSDNVPQNLRPYYTPPGDQYRGAFAFAQFDNPIYTTVAARNAMGAYVEIGFRPSPRWDVDLGVRNDVWLTGFRSSVSLDPRILVTRYLTDVLDVHAAFGLAHQPAVFLLPLPGVSDVALDRGLQRAIQSELGAGLELENIAKVELQLFLHAYSNLLFPELTIEKFNKCGYGYGAIGGNASEANVCESGTGFPRATALAYGGEIFIRRRVTETISGWLSYTLTWADAESDEGFEFSPVFDTRHVVNLVLQYRPTRHWRLGVRGQARSGQTYAEVTDALVRLERRLPGFYRIDAQMGYGWKTGWGAMELTVEWFNVTLSREARSYQCGLDITDKSRKASSNLCKVEYEPALFMPNLSVRAEF